MLHALTMGTLGGTERMTLRLVERLDPQRFASEVSVLSGWGETAARLVALGVPVHRLEGDRGTLRAVARLRGLVARGRYDILHLYGFRMSWIGRVAARLVWPRPVVVHGIRGLHVTEGEEVTGWRTRMAVALERYGCGLVDLYVANSRGAVTFLTERALPATKFIAVPSGIDPADWDPGRDRVPSDVPSIVCVANFRPIKRHVDLVEALAVVRDRGTEFRCVLVGDGPTRADVERLALARGLGDRVMFLGSQPPATVECLLRRADVFALVSLWEGLPASVLEAMAVALPVVGTDVPGIAEVVVDGETGYLVPPRQPAAVADRLDRLLAAPGQRLQMGRAGQRRVRQHFSLEDMVRAYEDLYCRLAGGGWPPSS